MKKHQLCCIGHITLDKVVTPQSTVYMPGGTAFYCSHAIRHFNDIDYALVTAYLLTFTTFYTVFSSGESYSSVHPRSLLRQ